jgi:poly(glycerol-phosphate) alpha-glucosyltransferase
MTATDLPAGRYLTCAIDVSPDYGGQTRALLMRNRILAREGGLSPSVLTFSAANDYDDRRRVLLERGLLLPEISLLNIYEHYREHSWSSSDGAGQALPELRPNLVSEEQFVDGTPWRLTYKLPGTDKTVYDYLRSDGTTFLRIQRFSFSDPDSWPSAILQVSNDGEVIGRFRSLGQWFRRWIRDLTVDDERAFVFMDSRYVVPHVVPMTLPRIHLIYLMHNIHVAKPRNWDSPVNDVYTRVLDRIGGLDAMVTLTERQRQDIAQRRGNTNNLFVVPNPVDMPRDRPEADRDPHLAAVVARLEPQKRLSHAVEAFAEVVKQVPQAKLDIYGDGNLYAHLQRAIERRGLTGSVTLRGHDPHAREALWRASAFLMTSAYEGYPLSTLESLSHGCPVVSYDIKYGPREQVTDGVEGFLVPDSDTAQLADRVVRLLKSPALVLEMGEAAIARAESHGTAKFISDWASVLQACIVQKPRRTNLRSVDFETVELTIHTPGLVRRLTREGNGPAFGRYTSSAVVTFSGILRPRAARPRETYATARVELCAVHRESGDVSDLPVRTRRVGDEFHVTCRFRLGDILGDDDLPESVQLRLRFLCENSVWETLVSRRTEDPPALEVSYDDGDALTIRRLSRTHAKGPGGA